MGNPRAKCYAKDLFNICRNSHCGQTLNTSYRFPNIALYTSDLDGVKKTKNWSNILVSDQPFNKLLEILTTNSNKLIPNKNSTVATTSAMARYNVGVETINVY